MKITLQHTVDVDTKLVVEHIVPKSIGFEELCFLVGVLSHRLKRRIRTFQRTHRKKRQPKDARLPQNTREKSHKFPRGANVGVARWSKGVSRSEKSDVLSQANFHKKPVRSK